MDDTTLTAEDEQQLREALADAPPGVKESFCRCWPAVKGLLDWLAGKLPAGRLKTAVEKAVLLGEAVYRFLDCGAEQQHA